MRRRLVSIVMTLCVVGSLSGCGDRDTIAALNSLQALNTDSDVSKDYSLSYVDEQNAVYAQVSNRTLLDLNSLTECSEYDVNTICNFMDSIDDQLVGKLYTTEYKDRTERFTSADYTEDEEVINSFMTDYMLTFFEQTPFYWQRSRMVIRGEEASSKSYVVDVDYKTIDFKKDKQEDSKIALGDKDYDRLVKIRANRWTAVLDSKFSVDFDGNVIVNKDQTKYKKLLSDFEKYYGNIDEILKAQRFTSPTIYTYNTGNQQTFSGLVDSSMEQLTGTVTFRFVLVPEYVLGVNMGLSCDHAYITNFSLDSDPTEGMEVFNDEGYATVTDEVYNLVGSYFKCLDDSDFYGLNKLTTDFGSIDRHYQDMFDSTYQKHTGFTVSLFGVTGTHITCGITISSKERAMYSNMTFPIYTDRYYAEIDLKTDHLAISNLVLLDRKLEGEPAIVNKDLDDSGFSADISLDSNDRSDIEKLICDFSAIQLKGDLTSDDFSNIVDTSISINQLEQLRESMDSLKGKQKVVYLNNYAQGTSNYASVHCRELFQAADESIVEASVVYDFIRKGGKWYVYNYSISSSVHLDTKELNAGNCLCIVAPGEVVQYTSQISASATTDIDEVSDNSTPPIEYEAYTPQLKKEGEVSETVKLSASEIDQAKFNSIANLIGSSILFEDFEGLCSRLESYNSDFKNFRSKLLNSMAEVKNIKDKKYTDSEVNSVVGKQLENLSSLSRVLDSALNTSGLTDEQKSDYMTVQSLISALQNYINK